MSRTYKVLRSTSDVQGINKEWVLVNRRGAKKFQQMVNKRCRRLDKIAIAEGINEMIDDAEEVVAILEEIFFDEWYEKDEEDEEDPFDWYEGDPFDWYEGDPFDWYDEDEYYGSLYY